MRLMTLHATRDRSDDTVTVHAVHGGVSVQVKEYRGHALNFWHELGRLVIDDNADRARAGYGRYLASCSGISVNGDQLPPWDELPEKIQEHWTAAFTE